MTKTETRIAAKIQRRGGDPTLSVPMAAHVLRECAPPPGAIVAGYWPLPDEIDPRFLLNVLYIRGHAVVLPETPENGERLIFRKWRPGAVMTEGRLGTRYPDGEILRPDFILIPLLAFDLRGNRLGHGGGYYDRTLAALPDAYRLGCAFMAQEIDRVPTAPHDEKLHAIATELGVRRFQK